MKSDDMIVKRLFLDTEWADAKGRELVSLALVSECGVRQFYAEIDTLPPTPTEFVKTTVYPLLDRSPAHTMSKARLTAELRGFLTATRRPCIVADYQNDLVLARLAIAGFDLPDPAAGACGPIPRPVHWRILDDGLTQMVLEDYFDSHLDAKRRRHHALVDAQALRATWLAMTGQASASWSATLNTPRGI